MSFWNDNLTSFAIFHIFLKKRWNLWGYLIKINSYQGLFHDPIQRRMTLLYIFGSSFENAMFCEILWLTSRKKTTCQKKIFFMNRKNQVYWVIMRLLRSISKMPLISSWLTFTISFCKTIVNVKPTLVVTLMELTNNKIFWLQRCRSSALSRITTLQNQNFIQVQLDGRWTWQDGHYAMVWMRWTMVWKKWIRLTMVWRKWMRRTMVWKKWIGWTMFWRQWMRWTVVWRKWEMLRQKQRWCKV